MQQPDPKFQIEKLMKRVTQPLQLGKLGKRGLSPPPDILHNIQGSTAGAGSGEFHVYRRLRRKEMTRVELMDAEIEKVLVFSFFLNEEQGCEYIIA